MDRQEQKWGTARGLSPVVELCKSMNSSTNSRASCTAEQQVLVDLSNTGTAKSVLRASHCGSVC
jgi:hypothetical protein